MSGGGCRAQWLRESCLRRAAAADEAATDGRLVIGGHHYPLERHVTAGCHRKDDSGLEAAQSSWARVSVQRVLAPCNLELIVERDRTTV